MAEKKSILKRFPDYIKGVRLELKKVVWPTRQEIITSTIVVTVTVLFFAVLIGVLDLLFQQLVRLVFARS